MARTIQNLYYAVVLGLELVLLFPVMIPHDVKDIKSIKRDKLNCFQMYPFLFRQIWMITKVFFVYVSEKRISRSHFPFQFKRSNQSITAHHLEVQNLQEEEDDGDRVMRTLQFPYGTFFIHHSPFSSLSVSFYHFLFSLSFSQTESLSIILIFIETLLQKEEKLFSAITNPFSFCSGILSPEINALELYDCAKYYNLDIDSFSLDQMLSES